MKKSVLFCAILLILTTACVLCACVSFGGEVVENPEVILKNVQKISLSDYKTEYWFGEELDLSGAVLKILLTNGDIKKLEDLENQKTVSVTGYNRFQIGTQQVTVKYGGKYSSVFEVLVKKPVVTDIFPKSYPVKTDYIEGDRIDMSGAEITVFMEDGKSVDVAVDNSIVRSPVLNEDKEFIATGSNFRIYIYYGDKEIEFFVNVAEKTLVSMEIEELPQKREYYLNDDPANFDPKGLKLSYTYNNGKSEVVDAVSQSNLRYEVDFAAPNNQSPVTVQYVADGEVKFSVSFTVVVNSKRYQSISIKTRPAGVTQLVEGAGQIDFSTGEVTVRFDDGSTEDFYMDDPKIQKSRYDNTILGEQKISVYYLNNQANHAEFTVYTRRKEAKEVRLSGAEDLKKEKYYEGQTAPISIAKLYYTVVYDNDTVGESTAVSESMLAEGSDLIATANGGAGGTKKISFVIEGITVSIELTIIPIAVERLEIDTLPQNLYVALSGAPDVSGGVVRVTYNNRKSEKIEMTDARFSVTADMSSASVGDTVAVIVRISGQDNLYAEYAAEIVEKSVKSVSVTKSPTTTSGYKYGASLKFAGAEFTVVYSDDSSAQFIVTEDCIENGAACVKAEVSVNSVKIPASVLLNGGKNVLTETAEIYLYYYGVRADRAFRVFVEERTVNGISILSTADVPLERFAGEGYDSVAGLKISVDYTDGSVESVVLTDASATRVNAESEIEDGGFYWYLTGDTDREGSVEVTVVYAFQNALGELSLYPDAYSVYYREAELLRIEGVYKSESGRYVLTDSLGAQPKGLTPYFGDYYLGLYYSGDILRYVPLTVSMTDYDVKNLTAGDREVVIRYNGTEFISSIRVTNAEVTGVTIGREPRKNYVYTESFSPVGGTLVRSYLADGQSMQDTVDMKEAKWSLKNNWPKSIDDFNGAAKVTVAVELRYENVEPVIFTVEVYQPLDMNVKVAGVNNAYGHVSNPSVMIAKDFEEFSIPSYTVRYATDADGNALLEGTPSVDANGNVFYPVPTKVGGYYVVVSSEGNRYYNPLKIVEEFKISPLEITLKPNYATKIYGTEDPEFTFTSSNQTLWDEAKYDENGDPLWTGSFVREAGEDVGAYKIRENENDRFTHPYFIISIEEAGTLTVRPALVRLVLDPAVLYFEKDEDGNAKNLKNSIDFLYEFVTVAADGAVTVVSEKDLDDNPGLPAYTVYETYREELHAKRLYRFDLFVQKDGVYDAEAPVDVIGTYSLQVTLSRVQQGAVSNYLFYDASNPGTGTADAYLSIKVEARPFATPTIGTTALLLETEETDLTTLETMVSEAEQREGKAYDLVVTDKFVYLWKYRSSASQRENYPEGKYLAYNTSLLKDQWLGEGEGQDGSGGFAVLREHLKFDSNGAFINVKFRGNGDDRSESTAIPFLIPNVSKDAY